jgi:hypothetical protein
MDMTAPLMPKATALWLIENTMLTFKQIADFTGLHILEVQTIADGESHVPVVPFDPLINQQLTADEIKRCEEDEAAQLVLMIPKNPLPNRKVSRKYTPVSKRSERPDAIAWLLKNNPQLSIKQITRLVGTTVKTVESVKNRTHRNATHIKPRCPVVLGLCKQSELDAAMGKAAQDAQPKENKA